jgi:hypothetical protein
MTSIVGGARLQHSVGWVLWKQGKYAVAEPLLRVAAANIPKTYGPTYRGVRIATSSLAMYRRAPADRGAPNALIALSHALIARRRGNGRSDAAAQWRGRLQEVDRD